MQTHYRFTSSGFTFGSLIVRLFISIVLRPSFRIFRVELFIILKRLKHLDILDAHPNALVCVVLLTVWVSPQPVTEKGSFLVLMPYPLSFPRSEELSGKDRRARCLPRPSSLITNVLHAASVRDLKPRRSCWGHSIPYTASGVSQHLLPTALGGHREEELAAHPLARQDFNQHSLLPLKPHR